MATAKHTWQIAIVVRILIDIMNNVIKRKMYYGRGFVNFQLNIPKYLFRRYVFSHLPLRPAK